MKPRLLIFLLFLSGTIYSQGINSELGFNDNYDQNPKALVCVDEFSYLVKFQKTSSFFSTCTLFKIDTLGTILWGSPITPILSEFIEVHEMIPSESGGVYVSGFGMPTCDVSQDCYWFIQKYDPNGNLDWTNSWVNSVCFFSTNLTGLSLTANNELIINYVDSASNSIVYTINSNGSITDSVQINPKELSGFCKLSGYEFIAYKYDSLTAFDAAGNSAITKLFSSDIQNVSSLNDSLFVLTLDSLFIFDNNLILLQGSDVSGFSNYSNLKVDNNLIRFVCTGINSLTVFELDHQLQFQNSVPVQVTLNADFYKDFSNSHLSVAINYPITLHHAIRYVDYSLNTTQSTLVNNTDIGVVGLDITQTFLQLVSSPGVYQHKVWAAALVKNYGNNVMNTCRISHRIEPWGICSEEFYTNEFFGFNLAPNDSIWINLDLVHSSINNFVDTIDIDLCVYTSYPNSVTDTIVPNDQFCTNVYLGMVGISENFVENISIFPNPVNDVFHIENPNLIYLAVYVYDSLGKLIFFINGSNEKFSFNLSNQSAGLHLVRIVSKNGEVTKKILKQ